MSTPALHPSWSEASWPSDVVPVPLGPDLTPLDAAQNDWAGRSGPHFLFVAPGAAAVHPDLVRLVRPFIARRPDVGIFYADDAVVGDGGAVETVHCKPSFNPALMLADDYMRFPLLVRADVMARLAAAGGAGAEDGTGRWRHRDAAWYRLCLAAAADGVGIDRIPETLIASFGRRTPVSRKSRAAAVARSIAEAGLPLRVGDGLTPETLAVSRTFDAHPEVTLVVPTRQSAPETADGRPGRPHIAALLDSLARSTYPQERIKVLIGDDCPDGDLYRGRSDRFAVTRIDTRLAPGESFNYAAKMNRLWRAADTDLMILMNDDIEVSAPGWIEALLTFAMDRGVGGVGARLLYPDGRIQHAGMFGGIFGVCAHPWYLQPGDAPSYEGWARTQRDCSAVTGAVFATRRAAMEAVNGFDERFSLDFNDVDLCLKMRMLGYRIVYTPFAEMIHHEKASRRDGVAPGDQVARFLRRWKDFLAEDPAYSPQLRIDTEAVAPKHDAARWASASAG